MELILEFDFAVVVVVCIFFFFFFWGGLFWGGLGGGGRGWLYIYFFKINLYVLFILFFIF